MNIIISVGIKTTAERLFDAVTNQQSLAKWFTPDTQAEPKVGGAIVFTFDSKYTLGFRVESLEKARRVVWSAVQAPPEWKASRIAFEATPDGDSVNFTFTHSALPESYESYGFFTYCWSQYVRSLKLLLETGTGEPYGSPASRAWHPID